MSYKVQLHDSKWNEIRDASGNLLYWASRRRRQIYRVETGYISGPINLFLGDNVTSQFSEEDIIVLCI